MEHAPVQPAPEQHEADHFDYSKLDEQERRYKAIRDLFYIFVRCNNTPMTDEEIFDKAIQFGLVGYNGVTRSDIIRGQVYRWNHVHDKLGEDGKPVKDEQGNIVGSIQRVHRIPPLGNSKKGKYFMDPHFASYVFGREMPDHRLQQVLFDVGMSRPPPQPLPVAPTPQQPQQQPVTAHAPVPDNHSVSSESTGVDFDLATFLGDEVLTEPDDLIRTLLSPAPSCQQHTPQHSSYPLQFPSGQHTSQVLPVEHQSNQHYQTVYIMYQPQPILIPVNLSQLTGFAQGQMPTSGNIIGVFPSTGSMGGMGSMGGGPPFNFGA